MPDYQNGKIYTIRCRNDNTLIYVGSTTQPLAKRWGGHKHASTSNSIRKLYSCVNGNWDDWYIELYEVYSCDNREQLNKREGEVIREIGTLNSQIAGRTDREYYENNKDIILEKQKEYYENNIDKIKLTKQEYRENNIDKIKLYEQEYRENNINKIKLARQKCYAKQKAKKEEIII